MSDKQACTVIRPGRSNGNDGGGGGGGGGVMAAITSNQHSAPSPPVRSDTRVSNGDRSPKHSKGILRGQIERGASDSRIPSKVYE